MVLKTEVIVKLNYEAAQQELDKFLLSIQPEQFKGFSVDNGMIWVVYNDQAPDRLSSLNTNKVSKQPMGDPTVDDHPKNTTTYIDNSCSEI